MLPGGEGGGVRVLCSYATLHTSYFCGVILAFALLVLQRGGTAFR